MNRIHSNWLEGFITLTDGLPSPAGFRRWVGISTIASALERKTWTIFRGMKQYCNMYIILVGPPGTGKTVAIKAGRRFIKKEDDLIISPDRITQQRFYQEIEDAKKQGNVNPLLGGAISDTHHSLTASIDELSIFIKRGDIDFMADLADLFDCPEDFAYKTKHSGENYASNVWVNLIGGTTPTHLKDIFSAESIELGFTARVIPVWEDAGIVSKDLFGENEAYYESGSELNKTLQTDYTSIASMRGAFYWADDAKKYLQEWYNDGLTPYPSDPHLRHYCERRLTHISKLCMIHSAAESNSLEITLSHLLEAKKDLLLIEETMPLLVEHLGDNRYVEVQRQIVKMVLVHFLINKKPLQENIVRRRLLEQIPINLLNPTLEELLNSKMIVSDGAFKKPNRRFKPSEGVILEAVNRSKSKASERKAQD